MVILTPYTKYTTQSYAHGDFIIDVCESEDMYECWLWHKDYGVKSHMFGLFKDQLTVDGRPILDIILNNLDWHENYYRDVYMDD